MTTKRCACQCGRIVITLVGRRQYHPACQRRRRQAMWRAAKSAIDLSPDAIEVRYQQALAVIQQRRKQAA